MLYEVSINEYMKRERKIPINVSGDAPGFVINNYLEFIEALVILD